jgi:hypothetical protein
MKVTEINFRKPTLNKVTVAKLMHYNSKGNAKKKFVYTSDTVSHW